MDESLNFAAGLASKAGVFLLQQFRSGDWDSRLKSDRTLVTSADTAADRLIYQAIQTHFPGEPVVSEELNPNSRFDEMHSSRYCWIVDPLDGTTNFSLGLPHWGVLIARLEAGEPHIAAAYFPVVEELFTAQVGLGAWLNGRPLRIQTPDKRRPLSFFSCCSRTHRHYHIAIPYKTRILGSAAYSLCSVARSTAILAFETSTKVWDLAAPWLIVQEAGGKITAWEDPQPFPYRPEPETGPRIFSVLAGANDHLVRQAQTQITPKG